MKLAINLLLSLGMLALCVWLVWPSPGTRHDIESVFRSMHFRTFAPYLAGYVGLLVVVQLTRALRWNYLLAPLGVRIPAGPLLAISSVGFMAILALPVRLGELVRPGLLRKRGVSATAALGTVAVERIMDGLVLALFVFGAFFAHRSADSPGWMMVAAFLALGLFGGALAFVIGAILWPEKSVQFWLNVTFLPKLSPRLAGAVERKAHDLIRGFEVMRDRRNMAWFIAWTLVYWACNGLGVYVLAHGFGLPLSLVGAFATMALVGCGIALPNSPGLVGQFQYFTLLGLSVYIAGAVTKTSAIYPTAFAFANTHYVLQVAWYVLCGALGLATRYVSFHDMWEARKTGDDVAE